MTAEIIETFVALRTEEIAQDKERKAHAKRMQALADQFRKPKAANK